MPPLTNSEISESENEAEGERENIMENKEEDFTLKEKTEGKLTKERLNEVPVDEVLSIQEESPSATIAAS